MAVLWHRGYRKIATKPLESGGCHIYRKQTVCVREKTKFYKVLVELTKHAANGRT